MAKKLLLTKPSGRENDINSHGNRNIINYWFKMLGPKAIKNINVTITLGLGRFCWIRSPNTKLPLNCDTSWQTATIQFGSSEASEIVCSEKS